MDEIAPEYDVVVLGTGASLPRLNNAPETKISQVSRNASFQGNTTAAFRCGAVLTLSSVLSVKGQKVLHIDRNDHYGG